MVCIVCILDVQSPNPCLSYKSRRTASRRQCIQHDSSLSYPHQGMKRSYRAERILPFRNNRPRAAILAKKRNPHLTTLVKNGNRKPRSFAQQSQHRKLLASKSLIVGLRPQRWHLTHIRGVVFGSPRPVGIVSIYPTIWQYGFIKGYGTA